MAKERSADDDDDDADDNASVNAGVDADSCIMPMPPLRPIICV